MASRSASLSRDARRRTSSPEPATAALPELAEEVAGGVAGRGRRRHLGGGEGNGERDVGQLDDVAGRPCAAGSWRPPRSAPASRAAPRPARSGGGRLLQRELCCRADSRTWPLARSACPTTTASSAATTRQTETMVRQPAPTGAGAAPSMPRRGRVGTTRSGARRVEGASVAARPGGTGPLRRSGHAGGRRAPSRGRRRHQRGPSAASSAPASSARWPAAGRSRPGGWRRSPPPRACGHPGTRGGAGPRRRRRTAGRGGRHTRPRRPRRRPAWSAGPHPSGS